MARVAASRTMPWDMATTTGIAWSCSKLIVIIRWARLGDTGLPQRHRSGGEFGGGDDIAVGQQGGGVDEGVADVLQHTPTAKLASGWRDRGVVRAVAVDEVARMLQVVIGGPAPDA